MRKRHVLTIALLVITGVIFFCFCTSQMAGPTTDEGNPQLIAVVLDSYRHPVGKAEVSVFRLDSKADSTDTIAEIFKVAAGITGADGICKFNNLISGQYSIQGFDADGNITGVKTDIILVSPVNKTLTDTIILTPPGGIKGVVIRGPYDGSPQNKKIENGFIQVKLREIDMSFITNPDGKYQFNGVPEGVYTLMYYAADGYYTSTVENVTVRSDKTISLDTVVLEKFPALVPPANLRSRFDSTNSVVNLSWNAVDYAYLRWYEVQRIDPDGKYTFTWHTVDTLTADTVRSLPSGLKIFYIVRSVDDSFNLSRNSNPVEITLP